jgi:putative ABC transport system permease protein
MLVSISWRNIWRSKTRSLVIMTAIAVGVFAGVYTIAFMLGWVNQRIDSVINTEVSHIQIHHADYLETYEVHDFIPDITGIADSISTRQGVKGVSARVLASGMAATAETGSGVLLTGIDPDRERTITDLHEMITEGEYLNNDKTNQIVIGEKLAQKLKAKVRSRVIVTLTEMDGTITGGAFRVVGIYRTANSAYDEMKAFVRADDLRNLLQIDAEAGHEIAILMEENNIESQLAESLTAEYPGLSVMKWVQLLPEMELMNESMNLVMYFFIVIILLALGFGIVNTMLMVILDRVKELGMLMAVGMNRMRVFFMIVLETVFLSLTGGIAGIALALIVTSITSKTGIDLSIWASGLNSMGFDAIVYPVIRFETVVVVAILVALTGVISALYPAKKAIGLKPAEALRIDM